MNYYKSLRTILIRGSVTMQKFPSQLIRSQIRDTRYLSLETAYDGCWTHLDTVNRHGRTFRSARTLAQRPMYTEHFAKQRCPAH